MASAKELPDWSVAAAQFLTRELPKHPDHDGWSDNAMTTYQIGCEGLAVLGYAETTGWRARALDQPRTPAAVPRWDDICITVLWLASQHHLLSYRMPDGSVFQESVGSGFVITQSNAPAPPPPNIAARAGLGPARCHQDVMGVLERLGLVLDGGWTKDAELVLWRTSPKSWSLNFEKDPRFAAALTHAVATMPKDIEAEISRLVTVTRAEIEEEMARHEAIIAQTLKRNSSRLKTPPALTPERAEKSLSFRRSSDLDDLFFRRWRLPDGWLSVDAAKSALNVFHDPLAKAMRKALMQQMRPDKPQFWQ